MLVNEEDPVKARLVDDRITTLLAQANLRDRAADRREGGRYLGPGRRRRRVRACSAQTIEILGLRDSARILDCAATGAAAGPLRDSLDQVIRFATLGPRQPRRRRAADRAPRAADRGQQGGRRAAPRPPLEIFAIAVAATLTLAFVTVLLVAGSLALEREENAFPRLTRGLVSPSACSAEKVAAGHRRSGLVVTLLMLAGLALFVPLHWGRFGLWLLAILAGGGGAGGGRGGARARRRARSARSRCSPSWSPCRSPSSR